MLVFLLFAHVKPPGSEDRSDIQAEYVLKMRDRMETAHRYACEQMKKSAVRQKRNYDHKVKEENFVVEHFVWLHTSNKKKGISPKLKRAWVGPYLITHKLSHCVYRIQLSPKAKPKVVHKNRFAIYEGTNGFNWFADERKRKAEAENVSDAADVTDVSDSKDDEKDSVEQNKTQLQGEKCVVEMKKSSDRPRLKRRTSPPKRFADWVE